jgi:hypothetical protein
VARLITKILKMYNKTSFFDIMSEVHKGSEDFSSGIGNFFKLDIREFCLEFNIKISEVNIDLTQYN